MSLDRDDNNMFVSKITAAIIEIDCSGKKITPNNLRKLTGYTKKDIELNLYEIQEIMDSLGID